MSGYKKIAAITIGSYTIRMLVAAFSGNDFMQPLQRRRVYTRLAEGFFDHGETLSPAAMDRTIQALNAFRSTADDLETDGLRIVCTGVVRRAKNRAAFLERIKEATGLSAEIISGKSEACLTAKGVLSQLTLPRESALILDLGGGSTEFYFKHESQEQMYSLDLGAAILTERYFRSDPPAIDEIRALEQAVDQMLEQAFTRYITSGVKRALIGTGGTLITLSAMLNDVQVESVNPERIQGTVLDLQNLEELWTRIRFSSFEQRKSLTGLDENRAKVIIAGLLITLRVMYFFKVRQVRVSFSDLLEGILLDFFRGVCHEDA